MLYIDEATSGLDAGTEARMMRLFRRLADEGRSIICITHNVDNVDQCHLVLILARGKLVFYGPPAEAPPTSGSAGSARFTIGSATRTCPNGSSSYRSSYAYQDFVENRLAEPAAPHGRPAQAQAASPPPAPPTAETTPAAVVLPQAPSESSSARALADRIRSLTARALLAREWLEPIRVGWNQFRVLTRRYLDLILGDRRGLRLLLLQAPIVGLFLLLGFLDKNFQEPMPVPRIDRRGDGTSCKPSTPWATWSTLRSRGPRAPKR